MMKRTGKYIHTESSFLYRYTIYGQAIYYLKLRGALRVEKQLSITRGTLVHYEIAPLKPIKKIIYRLMLCLFMLKLFLTTSRLPDTVD